MSARAILLCALAGSWPLSTAAAVSFIRGDTDANGSIDVSDAVGIFNYLFLSGEEPPCLRAADTNDSEAVDITDGIYILTYLFLGGAAPPAPFPECGRHPALPDLPCLHFEACRAVDEEACRAAGGTVEVDLCCGAVGDFTNLCVVGPCSCPPGWSHEVQLCECGEGLCWDGTECVESPFPGGGD